ncbi:Crossover junction endodeoxyribonuclease ruvC [Bacillus cereus]|nr:Crossover junction endodeoxyribonuclease ruvC [Bacillus cereus]ARO65100.1 Crossover junction endodeoxyribonuclease ruvC [Bacillus cereus]
MRVAVWELLDAYQPDVFVKEGLALNFGRFRASEIVSKATGVVEEAIASDFYKEKHQVIYEYKPSTIKKEVAGHGKAIKDDVQEAVFLYFDKAHFPHKVKRDGEIEYNDDATDAVGAILTHFIKNKIPFWTELSEDTKL